MKNFLKPVIAVAALALIVIVDLWIVDKTYFKDELYVAKDELQVQDNTPNIINEQILKDKDPHYRVFDPQGINDNRLSYFHRSVLGYHPAKLRIYQDIIERYFNEVPNHQILNALDAKYIITTNQQGEKGLMVNPEAYGAAWFVKAVKPVANEVEELQTIGTTNLRDTAIVQTSFLKQASNIVADSASTIQLTKYSNDEIEYSASTPSGGFAVLSEVYYPAGWNAYIDGQKTEIIRTNYFMRGLVIPQGKHTVKLIFEPTTVTRGMSIAYLSSWALVIAVLGGFFMQWWVDKKAHEKLNEKKS